MRRHFLLDPGTVFLNHGSFGACPRPVLQAQQRWRDEMERNPVLFLGRRSAALLAEARSALADHLGARADDLVFVANATTGVNIVARSLELCAGDEVLATDHEYGACDAAWQQRCAQLGASYRRVEVPLPFEPQRFTERLLGALTPRTRLVFASHVTSTTALVFPVAELCARARALGVTTLIDGAHAPGQIDLDLEAVGADFYSGNCHKWLCAPKGAGFLFARPDVQHLIEPLIISWGWESEKPGSSRFVDYLEWTGTHDIAAYLSAPAAIDFQAAHDWERVRRACRPLVSQARQQINALTGQAPICPDDDVWFRQMATMRLPACDTEVLKERLWNERRIEAPIITWNREPFVRVSVQGYNDEADIERLVAALAALLPAVQAPAPNG